MVKILLHAVSDTKQEGFVQRIAIYLLNSLACLVDGKQKLFLGDLGAIDVRIIYREQLNVHNIYFRVLILSLTLPRSLSPIELQTMLTLIHDRLKRKVFDDVMEVAWSTMWNVTDETAINCERFLDGGGMTFFLSCLQVNQSENEYLRHFVLY